MGLRIEIFGVWDVGFKVYGFRDHWDSQVDFSSLLTPSNP